MESVKTPAEVATLAKQGIIVAIPKAGETPEAAVKRVQTKHPGKRVVDPEPFTNDAKQRADSGSQGMIQTSLRFREALGRTKGYTNLCRMGHKLLPKPVCNRIVGELPGDYRSNTQPIGNVPESWMQPYSVCSHRWSGGILRRGFSIVEIRKNKLKQSLPIGRVWNSIYTGRFDVHRGAAWGSRLLKLEPVFAGLGEESLEKGALNALAALPYAFAGSRASDFSDDARHAVHGLANRPYNAIRLLVRLAVMWLGASICEESNEHLKLVGFDAAPDVRYIRSSGDMSTGLSDAINANAQTLYVEMSKIGRDPSILEVYFAAMSKRPQWRTSSGAKEVPTLLGLWPQIPNPHLSIYGRDEAVLHVEEVHAATIWMAIEVFVQQMGLREEWNEILESVATFTLRPEGDTVLCGHEAIKIALPESSLGPAALGPLMDTTRHWEDNAHPVVQPTLPQLMWRASARYMMWSLGYRDLCAYCGGREGVVFPIDAAQAKRTEWTIHSGATVVPANTIVELLAEDYGWNNLLGRVLRTVCGLTKKKTRHTPPMYASTAVLHKYSVQWEEVLPYTPRLPEGSAALSLVYPAKCNTIPPVNTWTAPLTVLHRHGLADALYTMATCGISEFGYAIYHASSQKYRIEETSIAVNYREVPADSQFFATREEGGIVIEPVFRATNALTAMEAFQTSAYNFESDWYVEHEIDESFEGLLKHFMDLDREMAITGEEWTIKGLKLLSKSITSPTVSPKISPREPTSEDAITDEPPSAVEDVIDEDKRRSKLGKERVRKVADSMMFFNEQRAMITRVLEEEPEWVGYVAELKALRGNPLEQKDEITRLAQLIMLRIRDTDPTLLPHYATDQTRVPQMMRAVAYMLKEFSAFVSGHDAIQLMTRMSEGCRSVARSFEVGEQIFDNISYSNVHGRQLPPHVSAEMFDKGIRLGLSVGDIVFTKDRSHLARLIDGAEKALSEKLAADTKELETQIYQPQPNETDALKTAYVWVQSGEPTTQLKPVDASKTTEAELAAEQLASELLGEPGGTGDVETDSLGLPIIGETQTEIMEEPILETRSEMLATEPTPVATEETPFGGEPPSQEGGGEDPQLAGASATDATETSEPIAKVAFETRETP